MLRMILPWEGGGLEVGRVMGDLPSNTTACCCLYWLYSRRCVVPAPCRLCRRSTDVSDPLIQRVDCIHVEVPDLESGLAFYRDSLGHELLWRDETSAGLRMADGDSEIVLNSSPWDKWKTDLLVESAESAAERFVEAGGEVVEGPFDIAIGKAVVVRDPWQNLFVLLDISKGQLATDSDKNVIGIEAQSTKPR